MPRRSLLAAAAAAPAILPGLGRAQGTQRATLRLKWLPQTQFAGFYLAKARGYYAAEGIDLTINPGGPNLLTENLVASGADIFGLSGGPTASSRRARRACPSSASASRTS
jgi:NitT/TauT family transport system substrate-binding protein